MTVESMEFVVQTIHVTVISAGWVKTAVLIVDVMDTVIAHKALVFVTSVKVKCDREKTWAELLEAWLVLTIG